MTSQICLPASFVLVLWTTVTLYCLEIWPKGIPEEGNGRSMCPFFQYSLCLCILQLICCIVCHVLVLNMGGLENVHYCFGVCFYLLIHYILPCLPAVLDILPSTNINIMWVLLNNFVYGQRLNVCILEWEAKERLREVVQCTKIETIIGYLVESWSTWSTSSLMFKRKHYWAHLWKYQYKFYD